jgi:hypothetical protein
MLSQRIDEAIRYHLEGVESKIRDLNASFIQKLLDNLAQVEFRNFELDVDSPTVHDRTVMVKVESKVDGLHILDMEIDGLIHLEVRPSNLDRSEYMLRVDFSRALFSLDPYFESRVIELILTYIKLYDYTISLAKMLM